MANKSLFKTVAGKLLPKTDALNEHLAPAYALSPKAQLAQYAATGCLNHTFYADADEQLAKVIEICKGLDAEFIAKTAIYARGRGFMKDMPALLCAILSVKDVKTLARIFPRVIDNGKMLRNFVQILRSGAVGRKSLGTAPKRLVNDWFDARSDGEIFKDSVGQAPSLADIVKMIHPKPATASRAALYGYFIGREFDVSALPPIARQYERFKAGETPDAPNVPFQMLTSLPLGAKDWANIARSASWQMTRMNLNAFARHGVFNEPGLAELIADRLRDERAIRKARVFPYQLLSAYLNASGGQIPSVVREALQDAMETAIGNIPNVEGKVYVFPDISGSMHSPVTGYRKGATSKVRCVDAAALVAAAVLRRNPRAEVIPFESKARGDLVVYVSDSESWIDAPSYGRFGGGATETMTQWAEFKRRNQQARMVCIDIQPYGTVQAQEREDILNVGGFSDQVFELITEFAAGRLSDDHWVGVIEAIEL